ncbi:MAG: hydroxymethylpyrimidine/phosphomethylpyrimidine kinase [Puniceicoccales bacterium]|jgi:hydroxymethylpyrimidine/phosphomethylpyrimidine kinase|nr:hydroxymethylpyrimidine/phosphomethylpyrimidine kinase [Puniceicoccales bacterium]
MCVKSANARTLLGTGAGGSTAGADVPVVLTIAGSDSGGGAGAQADLLAIAANGAHGASALTCLTAQNPDGVSGVLPVPPEFVLEQARQVARYFPLAAVKTGMLHNAGVVRAVAEFVREQRAANPALPFVLDPVLVATSGARLLDADALGALIDELVPLATVITPNLDEAAALGAGQWSVASDRWSVFSGQTDGEDGGTGGADSVAFLTGVAGELAAKLRCAVLLKGGHLDGGDTVFDVLVTAAHQPLSTDHWLLTTSSSPTVRVFSHPRVSGTDTHGSGCTLAAALAARLAAGEALDAAVRAAGDYLHDGMTHPLAIAGRRFIRRV